MSDDDRDVLDADEFLMETILNLAKYVEARGVDRTAPAVPVLMFEVAAAFVFEVFVNLHDAPGKHPDRLAAFDAFVAELRANIAEALAALAAPDDDPDEDPEPPNENEPPPSRGETP